MTTLDERPVGTTPDDTRPPGPPPVPDADGGEGPRPDRRPRWWERLWALVRRMVGAVVRWIQEPRPARPPLTGGRAVASVAFTMLALVCGWFAAQVLVLGTISHDRSQELLYRELRTQLAGAEAPTGPVVPPGDPVALLDIPAIGLQEVVVEGTASGDLTAGPGHKRNTVLPGQTGVSIVYGRATTYGGPFGDIGSLQPGDTIDVVVGQGEVSFSVIGVRRDGDPLPQPPAEGAARLTLVSGEGGGRLPQLSPGRAIYVDADVDEGFATPSGRPTGVPPGEEAMTRDASGLPMLTLLLGVLVALAVGVVWARQRFSTALVWVVVSPMTLALAWASTDAAVRLLPNLI